MSRQQYNPGATRQNAPGQQAPNSGAAPELQSFAAPIFTPAMPSPQNRWAGLAEVFAGGEVMAERQKQEKQDAEEQAAREYASNHSVDDLEKEIRSGNLERSRSPVFVAGVQNMWATNAATGMYRQTESDMHTGALRFNSARELDNYLVEQRNTLLAGHSEYARAGFNKTFDQGRARLLQVWQAQRDQTFTQDAVIQSRDYMANALQEVSSPDFKGTPQDAAKHLLSVYQFQNKALVLPPEAMERTLQDVMGRAAADGKPELVEALLNSNLPGGAGTIRATLGEPAAITLLGNANAKRGERLRDGVHEGMKPWQQQANAGKMDEHAWREWAADPSRAKYLTGTTIEGLVNTNNAALEAAMREAQKAQLAEAVANSRSAAEQAVAEHLKQGTLYRLSGGNTPQVLTEQGKVVNADVKAIAKRQLEQATAEMPMVQAAAMWAENNVENDQWKSLLLAGMTNIDSIASSTDGKPVGQLNDTATKALELYKQVAYLQPKYLQNMLGEKAYDRYSDIDFLTSKMGQTMDAAALLVSNAEQAGITTDAGQLNAAKIAAEANKIGQLPLYKPEWYAKYINGENTERNSPAVTSALARYATLLMNSGMQTSAETALKTATDYLANPQVSARVNGTVYLRHELPAAPGANENQDEWFGRWIDAVPKKAAEKMGFKDREVRLEYGSRSHSYTMFINGMLAMDEHGLPYTFTRQDIEGWYKATKQADIDKAVSKAKEHQRAQAPKVSPAIAAAYNTSNIYSEEGSRKRAKVLAERGAAANAEKARKTAEQEAAAQARGATTRKTAATLREQAAEQLGQQGGFVYQPRAHGQ